LEAALKALPVAPAAPLVSIRRENPFSRDFLLPKTPDPRPQI
jgi:hypothetical protein